LHILWRYAFAFVGIKVPFNLNLVH